ncbi:FkbM family methyltransferase [Azospirillum fermentarium]|uniref:FkbM family methyltransferase n=1 Tax=Azospirillum fermentarium TaxID=1233114 RepID=UPI002225DBF6|nr:FkbM family methyltransferase [Azospirillum fermentarium]MCW2249602.1 FkbM family methyltransferase [Azospirillum fermentarium]
MNGRFWSELARKLRKAAVLVRTPRFCRGLLAGVAAGIEHEALLRGLGDVRTVVDVGANKGQFSLLALELFPHARVYAFEPLAAAFTRLGAWSGSEPRLVRHCLALAEASGQRTMHVSARMDSSSLHPISQRQTAQFPGTQEVGEEPVAAVRLDEIVSATDLQAPSLLKIDTQGGEIGVLRGAAGVLPCFDWVYVECSFVELYQGQGLINEVTDLLAAAGFQATVYWQPCWDAAGNPVQADVLFRRLG